MIDWLFIFIPVVVSLIILLFWTKKIVWWEVALLIVPSSLLILLLNTIMVSYNTSDTEYLGSYITSVNYYEPWNEEVPCRHPIYCTRTYPCGKSTCTSTYVCGHVHLYDVDYHPEYWTKEDNYGNEFNISESEFKALQKLFNTKSKFVELNRDYHSIDGDAYINEWAGEPERSSTMVDDGSYVNKIMASHSVFKFENITEKEVKKFGLYNYPAIVNDNQKVVLGHKISATTERKLKYLNGYYGPKKEFKMFVLFFKNKSESVVRKQRSYWEGGNKNEFIICIGIDGSGNYQWVDAFSWMSKPSLEVEVEDFIDKNKDMSLKSLADWMPKQIEDHWKRRNFDDFDYLQVELTETQLWWVMIIVMIYNIIISIWVINNEFENNIITTPIVNSFNAAASPAINLYDKITIFIKDNLLKLKNFINPYLIKIKDKFNSIINKIKNKF